MCDLLQNSCGNISERKKVKRHQRQSKAYLYFTITSSLPKKEEKAKNKKIKEWDGRKRVEKKQYLGYCIGAINVS